jgi:hypothetical protein
MRRVNEDHRATENASTALGSRESRTSTDRPSLAISTQLPWSALKLLLRQVDSDCRLGRLSMQHPSVRRVTLCAATRDEGVDLGRSQEGYAARSLPTFPARSVDDLDFFAYAGIRINLSVNDTDVVY